jgi:predicted MFS family arabinose efflux permease
MRPRSSRRSPFRRTSSSSSRFPGTSGSPERSPRRESGLALVTLTAVAVGITYTNHAPLIPVIGREFRLSDVESGLLTTALFLASVITFLVGGGIADRFGPRRILAIGLALALAGNVAFALAPAYTGLLAGKAVTGLGSGLAFNAGTSYIAGLYGDARSHFGLGLFGGGYPLGSAIGIWAMPPLLLFTDWRGAFLASSLAIAAVLLAWWRSPRPGAIRPAGTILAALGCANCWWTSAQHAAGFGLGLAAGTWITVYLLREFSLPLEVSGLLGSLLLAIAVFARPFGGLLLRGHRVSSIGLMRIAQTAILIGVTLLALPERPLALAIAGTLAVGLGVGIPYAAVFNTAAASLPRAPGSAQGLAAVGGTAGALLAAPAMGYAVQTWGFAAAWLILAAISGLALTGTFLMRGEEQLA